MTIRPADLTTLAKEVGWEFLEGCPMCGSADWIPLPLRRGNAMISKCKSCRIVFLNPRAPEAKYHSGHLEKRYIPRIVERGLLAKDHTPIRERIYGVYRKVADLATKYARGERIVDIGCGIGLSTIAIGVVAPIPVLGFDINEEFVGFGRDVLGVDVHLRDVVAEPLRRKVLTATLNSVIEHIPDPVGFLTAIRVNLLAPGGVLVVTAPNIVSLQFIQEASEWHNINGGHLWYFSERSLGQVAEMAGYSILDTYREPNRFDGDLGVMAAYVSEVLEVDVNLTGGVGLVLGV
jgi:SAM-dependent methyltransferase